MIPAQQAALAAAVPADRRAPGGGHLLYKQLFELHDLFEHSVKL